MKNKKGSKKGVCGALKISKKNKEISFEVCFDLGKWKTSVNADTRLAEELGLMLEAKKLQRRVYQIRKILEK